MMTGNISNTEIPGCKDQGHMTKEIRKKLKISQKYKYKQTLPKKKYGDVAYEDKYYHTQCPETIYGKSRYHRIEWSVSRRGTGTVNEPLSFVEKTFV
jgi:hypothetical protein